MLCIVAYQTNETYPLVAQKLPAELAGKYHRQAWSARVLCRFKPRPRLGYPFFTFFFRFPLHCFHQICVLGSPMSVGGLKPRIKILALNVRTAYFSGERFHSIGVAKKIIRNCLKSPSASLPSFPYRSTFGRASLKPSSYTQYVSRFHSCENVLEAHFHPRIGSFLGSFLERSEPKRSAKPGWSVVARKPGAQIRSAAGAV